MPASFRPLVLGLTLVAAGLGCGKKGAPLAPLARVPAKVAPFSVERSGAEVFVSFAVPATNIGGAPPADLDHIEVFAVTAERIPVLKDGVVPPDVTLVATLPVRPPPPLGEREPVESVPPAPGLVQGQRVVIREVLDDVNVKARDAFTETPVVPAGDLPPALPVSPPAVWTPDTGRLQRYYVASGVSRRARRGPWSDVHGAPVSSPPAAPTAAVLTYDAATLTLTWTPGPNARTAPAPPEPGLLESKPFGPQQSLTKYNVYDAPATAIAAGPADPVTRPTPLNTAPLEALRFDLPGVAFGRERCLVIRALDAIGGVVVEGLPSSPACATPVDTFPPPAPAALEAVGGVGVISLIWEGVEADDLAGYLVFRGEAPGAPTTPLTPSPIRESSFEDRTAAPGVRYVYVVVAVDSASPANRSAPSNRVEETARQ